MAMTTVELVFDQDYFEKGMEVLAWAKAHCPGYEDNHGISSMGGALIDFEFNNEHDATLFALRWAELIDRDD
jgi:hypothetical protein